MSVHLSSVRMNWGERGIFRASWVYRNLGSAKPAPAVYVMTAGELGFLLPLRILAIKFVSIWEIF